MAADIKVADLYGALGIRVDPGSLKKARNEFGRFVKGAEKQAGGLGNLKIPGLGGIGRGAARGAKGLLGGLVGGVGLGGLGAAAAGAGIALAAKDAIDFDAALTSLDISSAGAMGKMEDVRDQMLKVSRATGVAKEDLVAGASAFVALTGNGEAASKSLETFARVQKATGATMEDIAGSAAALNQSLKIDPKDFEQAFSVLVKGGKLGAVELKDMASLLASLGPQFSLFAGSEGIEGMSQLAGGLQLARQGFGSAAEAATGMKALMTSLISKAGNLKKRIGGKAGIQVFEKGKDGVKRARNIVDIVEDLANSELAKDPEKLAKALGSDEALKAYLAITKVKGAWRDTAAATMNANDIAEDYNKRQDSASGKLALAWNALKVSIAEAFSPERVTALVEALEGVLSIAEGVIDAFLTLGDWLDPMGSIKHARRMREEAKAWKAEQVASAGRQNRVRNIQTLGSMFGGFVPDLETGAAVAAQRIITPEFRAAPEHAAAERVAQEAFQSRPVVLNQTINPSQGMSEPDLAALVHRRFKMDVREAEAALED